MTNRGLHEATKTLMTRCQAFLEIQDADPQADLSSWARDLIKDCDRLEEHLASMLVSELKKQRRADEQSKREHHRRIAQDIQAIY
jgi:Na+/phosphate symporter